MESAEKKRLVDLLWRQSCQMYIWDDCEDSENLNSEQRLRTIDSGLIGTGPLFVISNDSDDQIGSEYFSINGESRSNMIAADKSAVPADDIVLWGNGFIEARVFTFDPVESEVEIRALNDNPPPVNLDVEWDESHKASLSYSKGDEQWETQSTQPVLLSPGFHVLRIYYRNDYYDADLDADRNAYIGSVSVRKP